MDVVAMLQCVLCGHVSAHLASIRIMPTVPAAKQVQVWVGGGGPCCRAQQSLPKSLSVWLRALLCRARLQEEAGRQSIYCGWTVFDIWHSMENQKWWRINIHVYICIYINTYNRSFIWAIHIHSSMYSFIFFLFFSCISVMLYANLVGGTEPNLVQLNPIKHRPPNLHIPKYSHRQNGSIQK